MTTTERIVETYYRLCKQCFTMPDVKVIKGNNRQLDLLAYCLRTQQQYHVEISVTHREHWCPTPTRLAQKFEYKFFGNVHERIGEKTDYTKGKTYQDNILDTYKAVGFDPDKVCRVWVCWTVKDLQDLDPTLDKICQEKELDRDLIQVVSFRDEILPQIFREVGTSNYDDDTLRTLSLILQYQRQTQNSGCNHGESDHECESDAE